MKEKKSVAIPMMLNQSEISILLNCVKAYQFLGNRSDIVQSPNQKGVMRMHDRLLHADKKIVEREKLMFGVEGKEPNYLLKKKLRLLRKKNESNV
jgi:hypothetical protein